MRVECDNWGNISALSTVCKIIAKNRTYLGISRRPDHSGSSCTDHFITLRIIVMQDADFKSPVHLHFIHFEEAFDSVSWECVRNVLHKRVFNCYYQHMTAQNVICNIQI